MLDEPLDELGAAPNADVDSNIGRSDALLELDEELDELLDELELEDELTRRLNADAADTADIAGAPGAGGAANTVIM